MPKRNDPERRAQRKIAALQRSHNPNERLLGNVADVLQRIRMNEDARLCDICALKKRECEQLSQTGPDAHVFSPMTPQQQLKYLEEREATRLHEEDVRKQHFSGHKPDCTMRAVICYVTAGISARE